MATYMYNYVVMSRKLLNVHRSSQFSCLMHMMHFTFLQALKHSNNSSYMHNNFTVLRGYNYVQEYYYYSYLLYTHYLITCGSAED